MDILRRLFEGDSASRLKIHLDAEDSWSSEGSGCAPRHCRKGKGKTSKGAPRHLERQPTPTSPLSPAARRMDKTAGIAESPQAEGWEWPGPAVEKVTVPPRVRMDRASNLPTTVILKLTLRHKTDFTDRAAASAACAATACRFRSFRRLYVSFLISLISYLVQ